MSLKETPRSSAFQVGAWLMLPTSSVHAQSVSPHQSRKVGSFTMSPSQSSPSEVMPSAAARRTKVRVFWMRAELIVSLRSGSVYRT